MPKPKPATCKHEGCNKPPTVRGYCSAHWGELISAGRARKIAAKKAAEQKTNTGDGGGTAKQPPATPTDDDVAAANRDAARQAAINQPPVIQIIGHDALAVSAFIDAAKKSPPLATHYALLIGRQILGAPVPEKAS